MVPWKPLVMRLIPISVGCHEGFKADETPRWFILHGQRFEVAEITDRWYQASPDPTAAPAAYFRVRTTDGGTRILRLDHETLAWSLVEAS